MKKNSKYEDANMIYSELDAGKYTAEIQECKYNIANSYMSEKKYDDAIKAYTEIADYSDAQEKIDECNYLYACELDEQGDYKKAKKIFTYIKNYKESSEKKHKLKNKCLLIELMLVIWQ